MVVEVEVDVERGVSFADVDEGLLGLWIGRGRGREKGEEGGWVLGEEAVVVDGFAICDFDLV